MSSGIKQLKKRTSKQSQEEEDEDFKEDDASDTDFEDESDPVKEKTVQISRSSSKKQHKRNDIFSTYICNAENLMGKCNKRYYYYSLNFCNPSDPSISTKIEVGQVFFSHIHTNQPLFVKAIYTPGECIIYNSPLTGRSQKRVICADIVEGRNFVRSVNSTSTNIPSKISKKSFEMRHYDIAEIIDPKQGVILSSDSEKRQYFEEINAEFKYKKKIKDAQRFIQKKQVTNVLLS